MAIKLVSALSTAQHIQFQNTSGTNTGKIEASGDDLIITNSAGNVLFGDLDSDVYIGDGVNSVDVIFEQSGAIRGETGSSVTLTIGSSNTTLNLYNPNLANGASLTSTLSMGTGAVIDFLPDTGAIINLDGQTILKRNTFNGGITLGHDDAVIIAGGDTYNTLESNISLGNETVYLGAEGGVTIYAFPNNDTAWSNRQQFSFNNDGKMYFGTAADTNLYRSGGNTLKTDDDFVVGGTLTAQNEVHWDLSAGEYAGDPRAVAMGYSGGNYGQLGYGLDFTTTSGVHTYAINDIATRVDLYDGIQVYTSTNGGTIGSSITWTELLDVRSSVFQYKGNNILYGSINNNDWSGADLSVANGGTGASTASAARTNLGLGTAATSAATDFVAVSGDTMTGNLTMSTNNINFNTSDTNPNFIGDRSTTRLNDRSWSTEGGWAYSTFDDGSGDEPSATSHNANGLLNFNTHSGNYNFQIAMVTSQSEMYLRNQNGGGFNAWRKVITDADSVSDLGTINNSNWSGTDLAITNGGTGASTASAARTNLGLGTAATSAATDFVAVSGDTMTGTLTVPRIHLTNSTNNDVGNRITVYESGATSYGMMLWNDNGTSGDWATMIYGPNQSNRKISFGKANANFPGTKDSVDELAYVDLDNGNFVATGTLTASGYNDSNWNTAYSWGNHASAGYLTAHPNITAASSVNNSGRAYIQDITVDSNGHVTGITSATETVVNTDTVTSVGVSGSEVSGTVTLAGGDATTVSQSGNTITIRSTNTEYTVGDGGLTQKNFTTTLKNKLDGIEASADVTDATNVSAAGALMKSGGTMTGTLTTSSGNNGGIYIGSGGTNITSVTPSSKDVIIQDLDQLRFGGASWDWNAWAGIKFDDSNEILYIGGPAASQFSSNASPPTIDVNFVGVDEVQLGGNALATQEYVNTAVSNVVASAPAALDTLNELAAALGDDANFSTTMSTALGNRLRVDTASQGLTSTQKSNARTNLGLGTLATLNSVNAATITDNSVGAAELNVSGNGSSGQVLTSDGDGTFSWTAKTTNTDTITSIGTSGNETTGTVTLTAGNNVTLTQTGNTIEIRANDSNTTYSAGTGLTLSGTTFSVTSGTYAAASHTHAAGDVTSGTFATARIPNLAASKITSGTLDNNRINQWLTDKYTYQTYSSNGVYMPMVKGGLLTGGASSVTGRLRIKVPHYKANIMQSFVVDVYEYNTDRMQSYIVSGYSYGDANASWYNTSAIALQDSDNRNLTVRFGKDTTNGFQCVSIGETNTTWTYPNIVVRDYMAGHDASTAEVLNDWTVEFVTTDTAAYDASHSNNSPIIQSTRISGQVSVANGGTGSNTAAGARTNLGLGSLATLSTVDAATITNNSVGAAELNVSGNGTSGQVLTSDGDGTFSWTAKTTNTDTITSVGVTGSETSGTITLTGAGATTITQSGGAIEIRSTNTEYTVGDGGLTQNNFTNALKTKLDGIATGADVTPSWVPATDPGYLTSSSTQSKYLRSDADDLTTGALTIGDGSNQARLLLKKADNNTSNHIEFYNGTTRVGEIGCHDNTWLRINQTTANNIYTPRYIRADSGFFVDGTSKGINGSGNFIGGTIAGASDANVSNWDTAYGWGNHADAGYLTTSSAASTYATTDHGHSDATTSSAGFMSTADKTKLDGIASGADVTPSWVPASDPSYLTGVAWGDISSKPAFSVNGMLSSRSTTAIDTVGDSYGVTFNYLSSSTTNKPSGTDHALMTMSYSNAWQTQLAQDWRNKGRMYLRGQNNGTWSSWVRVHSTDDFSTTDVANGVTAHGWGNHASAGYSTTDTVTSVGVSGSETTGTVTIAASGAASVSQSGSTITIDATNTTYTVGDGGLTQKNFTTALKTKLDGIADGATVYGGWNLLDGSSVVSRVDSLENVKFTGANISGTGSSSDPFIVTTPNTTYTAGGDYGIGFSGTEIRLKADRRRNISTADIYTGNTHDYTFYDADIGIRWYTAGAEEMRLEDDGDLHVDGDVIAFSTTVSDARLKDDVETIENATDKVKQLRGVEYTWNKGSRKGQREIGVIAQEVEAVVPEVVHDKKLPLVDDETYKTVDYEKLVALLIESNKELAARVETLEAKLDGLTK
jgi:hypothetical protein